MHSLWSPLFDKEARDERKPLKELSAHRVALLPGGWVRAYTGYDVRDDTRYMVDVLFAPGEVIAIQSTWDSERGPGERNGLPQRSKDERWKLWLDSWPTE